MEIKRAKLKNIAKSGIYVCICHFFFVTLRAEISMLSYEYYKIRNRHA